MRVLTNKKIEKRAVFELIDYIEDHIDRIILQSVEEHDKLNGLKKIQGLYHKVMIHRDCVRNAIKNINSHSISILSEKDGGDIKESRNGKARHSQVSNNLTEVSGYE